MTIEGYFTERESLEQPEYQRTYEQLSIALGENLLEGLMHSSFIILKPDAYLRGLMPRLIDELSSRGIQPISQKVITFDDGAIEELYKFVKQKYASTWWVMRKGYSMAPSLPMLVVGDKKEFPHLSARIRDIVGPTTPLAGNPEQIRYSFAGTNKVFNLIHATDDPAAAAREALVFFNIDTVKRWLQAAKQ